KLFDEAEPICKELIQEKGYEWEYAAGHLGMIYSLRDSRIDDEVIQLLREGEKKSPTSTSYLGDVYRKQGKIKKATRYYQKAFDQGEVIATVPLGNIYWDELGDLEKAEEVYRFGYESGEPFAAFNLALLLLDEYEDRYDEAIE